MLCQSQLKPTKVQLVRFQLGRTKVLCKERFNEDIIICHYMSSFISRCCEGARLARCIFMQLVCVNEVDLKGGSGMVGMNYEGPPVGIEIGVELWESTAPLFNHPSPGRHE